MSLATSCGHATFVVSCFASQTFTYHRTGSGCCGGALTVFDEYGGGIWNGIADHSVRSLPSAVVFVMAVLERV